MKTLFDYVFFRLLFALILIAGLSVFVACDNDDDDDNDVGTNPVIHDGIDGLWEITLTPHDTLMGEAETHEELYLYEHNGAISGYQSVFNLHGSRIDNRISIDVFNSHSEVGDVESQMTLTLIHDDTLKGTGSIHHQAIEAPVQEDGSIHEKFQTTHEDWDGGEGGIFFYDVIAIRIGDAPAEATIQQSMTELDDIGWCDVLSGISSFAISIMSDNIVRPFGSCWLQHDGGGYYLAGQTGPGSLLPFYTQTVYFPYEYSWCGARSYSFTISLEGPILGWDLIEEANNMHNGYLDPLGLSQTQFGQVYSEMVDAGRFAICLGYSVRTHNTSFYLLTDGGSETWNADLVEHYNTAVNGFAPSSVYHFRGSRIHDTWTMNRSLSGLCNTPVLFVYLCGTHKVYFD